jgi:hypothetical protein
MDGKRHKWPGREQSPNLSDHAASYAGQHRNQANNNTII